MPPTKLDPAYQPLLDLFPKFEFSADALPAIREQMDNLIPPVAETSKVEMRRQSIPSHNEAHDVPVLIYRATTAPSDCPVVLEIHGGGYIVGTAAMGDASNRALAESIQGMVVSVDYRLAPESCFPGPVEDCYSALLWIDQNAQQLGISPKHIGVIGTSAGGGLAAATCLLARDRAEVCVAFQGLLMPMLDDRTVTRMEAQPNSNLGEFIWNNKHNRFAWQAMLNQAPGADGISYYAAPARAPSLDGLPPTYLSIGALDLFCEEAITYGTRLLTAGVPVDIHVYAGTPHGYTAMPEALASEQDAKLFLAAIKRALSV